MLQTIDHGVPTELNSQIMCCAEEFFSLPVEEKMQYAIQAGQFVRYGNGRFIKDDPFKDWRELYARHATQLGTFKASLQSQFSSESLGIEADAIEKACGEGQQKILLNYYPTCPHPALTLGLKRRTNPGTLTIILQDNVGGLQATKDDGETWVTVEPIDGAFLVNIRDHMHVSAYIYCFP
eukprot:PITA_10357